jgi:diguanylate cyclase (GGDEF)-like protein
MPSVVDATPDTKPVSKGGVRPTSARGACLVHIYPAGPCIGRRYLLDDGPVELGRGEDCDIPLADPSASRCHARVEPGPDGHRVVDLRSTNGTFVNQRRVGPSAPLHDGDYLQAGGCIYRYLAGGNIEAEYHEEIYRLAIQDALTRVSNRRALTEFLDREVLRSRRHARPLSVVLFDIDHFKAVNDRLGHLCGDQLLRDLVDRVRPLVRHEDLLARYGGEEFALVLVETPHAGAVVVAERLRKAIAGSPFRVAPTEITVTVSGGVATTSGDPGLGTANLLRLADERMYHAKRAGRNRVAGEEADPAPAAPPESGDGSVARCGACGRMTPFDTRTATVDATAGPDAEPCFGLACPGCGGRVVFHPSGSPARR